MISLSAPEWHVNLRETLAILAAALESFPWKPHLTTHTRHMYFPRTISTLSMTRQLCQKLRNLSAMGARMAV